ncbi:MAG TPA: sigma-70 family RNA polymerase sigma factor [Polyangia bacterium]|jgi:RNA polymerase sigma-70 factor (ECF subfamily)
MASLATTSSSNLAAVGATAGSQRCGAEAKLIRATVAGDRAAARELHKHYYPIVSSFLRKLGVMPHDLEDATQEVFTQFFRYVGSFRGDAELKTWVFRLCVTEARRVRRRRRIAAALAGVLKRQPPEETVPPRVTSDRRIQELAKDALGRMDPDQRLAFVLFEIEGVTGREAAEIAGKSMAAMFRRLYEAQAIFRETLGIETPPQKRKDA